MSFKPPRKTKPKILKIESHDDEEGNVSTHNRSAVSLPAPMPEGLNHSTPITKKSTTTTNFGLAISDDWFECSKFQPSESISPIAKLPHQTYGDPKWNQSADDWPNWPAHSKTKQKPPETVKTDAAVVNIATAKHDASVRSKTPQKTLIFASNRSIVGESSKNILDPNMSDEIMNMFKYRPMGKTRKSPNTRRFPWEERTYKTPSPAGRFSDGHSRKKIPIPSNMAALVDSEASDAPKGDKISKSKVSIPRPPPQNGPDPPKPEEKNVSKSFIKRFEKKLKIHDEKINKFAESVVYIKQNVYHVNQRVNEQSEAVGEVKARVSKVERVVASGVKGVKSLQQDVARIDNEAAKFRQQIGDEFVEIGQQFKNTIKVAAVKIRKNEEAINEHAEVIYDLAKHKEHIDNEVEAIKNRPIPTGGYYQKVKTMPATVEALKHMGVVFNDNEIYHPHFFVETFEANLQSVKIDEVLKCNLFRSLIEVNGAKNWKDHMKKKTKYSDLKAAFFIEFWSKSRQKRALQHYIDESPKVENMRERVRQILKWVDTLRHIEKMDEAEIIEIVFEKLPTTYQIRITHEERESLELLIQKLEKLEITDEDNEKPKKYIIGRSDQRSMNDSRFMYKDYESKSKRLIPRKNEEVKKGDYIHKPTFKYDPAKKTKTHDLKVITSENRADQSVSEKSQEQSPETPETPLKKSESPKSGNEKGEEQ